MEAAARVWEESGTVPLGSGAPDLLQPGSKCGGYSPPPRTEVSNTCFRRGGCISRLCAQTHPGTQRGAWYSGRRRSRHHARAARPAPPTRRRGHEAWAPPRRVRLLPGPCLQLSWARGEPGAGPLSRAEGAGALYAGAGPGAESGQRLLWGRGGDAAPRTEVRKLPESRGELAELGAHRGDGRLGQSPVQGAAGRVPGARGASSRGARVRARAGE